jgi:nicotinamide riboside transporter PnuC
MKTKAQAGLEYLMTYGWALILIATVVGVLVFIVSSPAAGSELKVSVDSPEKFTVKGAELPFDSAEPGISFWSGGKVILQNVTGGKITVTGFSVEDADFSVEPTPTI